MIQATPTSENTIVTEVAVLLTPSPSPTSTADPTSVSPLIASFSAAGAGVADKNHIQQSISSILGHPFTEGSQANRSEPYSGPIAGIGDYGVSFQHDSYLATGIQSQIVAAFTEDNGMNYLLMPRHLAFTFANSYADSEPLLQRQQLNLETMPQIVVYSATAYAAIHPIWI